MLCHTLPIWFYYFQYSDDDKWVMDREKLALEKTLGEGEFGLVVKGVYSTGSSEESRKYVAVKMLKRKLLLCYRVFIKA